MKRNLWIVLVWVSCNFSAAQVVQISAEISLKNDFAYYVIPSENGRISLFRDKAFRLSFQTLDEQFNWSTETDITLPGKKWRLLEIYKHKNMFGFLVQTKLEDQSYLLYQVIDANGQVQRTDSIIKADQFDFSSSIRPFTSEDDQLLGLVYLNNNDQYELLVYHRYRGEVILKVNATEFLSYKHNNVQDLVVTDHAEVFLLSLQNEGGLIRKKVGVRLTKLSNKGIIEMDHVVNFDNELPLDFILKYDHKMSTLHLCGVYAEKNGNHSEGYYAITWNQAAGKLEPKFFKFSEELYLEWTGKGRKKESNFHLISQQISFREDGSLLLFLESNKELGRKSNYGPLSEGGGPSMGRWVDYYYDDIIVVCLDKNAKVEWEKVLHKKQYSQDDDGLFSSFFLMSTEDYLRVIFNDEIKNESTVSEYLLLSDGRQLRKSVLNTSFKNLNLRFIDALQLNADELLVPSENNGKLSLVKISF